MVEVVEVVIEVVKVVKVVIEVVEVVKVVEVVENDFFHFRQKLPYILPFINYYCKKENIENEW